MTAVLARVHRTTGAAENDDLDLHPALAACVQLGLAGPHLAPSPQPTAKPALTESAFGMHLHAATTVDGRDRKQLERLCRYLLRPPFAHDAVRALPGGRVRVDFKAAWRSGAAHADMSADKFLARLCALVPPPGFHMTRYFGVFANRHHLRPRILPSAAPMPGQQLALALTDSANLKPGDTPSAPAPRRLGWAKLLARVFAIDGVLLDLRLAAPVEPEAGARGGRRDAGRPGTRAVDGCADGRDPGALSLDEPGGAGQIARILLIGGISGIGLAPTRALLQRGDRVIALIASLLSDASRSLSGQILRPDGGLSSLRILL